MNGTSLEFYEISFLTTTRGSKQMPAKKTAKDYREACLETLRGLRTLVEMQQTLILQAIEQLDNAKTRPTRGKKSRSG